MSFKDFRIIETIGKGSFASVYKVVRKSDNKVYALKRVKISKMTKKEIADALNEIRFLASIRQKNIVGFLQAFLENNESELCIIMEYCGCGDLAQKVERYKKKRQHIDEQVVWKYLIQSLKALKHLHENGICHRDIKTANTFLAEDGSVKIGDMNVSKRIKHGHLQTQIGTPYYMSPEIWNNRPYNESSDIWSLGCMIYELCALRPPFTGDSFPALKRAITVGRYAALPRVYSESLQRMVSIMLKLNARDRSTADALLRSAEVQSRMHLDTATISPKKANIAQAVLDLIGTIRVPQKLNKLNLPKPCYPDTRPNSPSAWTVAEQKRMERKVSALPPVPSLPSLSEDPSSYKENRPFPEISSDGLQEKSRSESVISKLGVPQTVLEDQVYARRPLAPTGPARANRNNGRRRSEHTVLGQNDSHHPARPPAERIAPAEPVTAAPSGRHQRPAGNPYRLYYQQRAW